MANGTDMHQVLRVPVVDLLGQFPCYSGEPSLVLNPGFAVLEELLHEFGRLLAGKFARRSRPRVLEPSLILAPAISHACHNGPHPLAAVHDSRSTMNERTSFDCSAWNAISCSGSCMRSQK